MSSFGRADLAFLIENKQQKFMASWF